MSAGMNRQHGMLTALLVVQLLLAAALWSSSGAPPLSTGKEPLFAVRAEDVLAVEIVSTSARDAMAADRIELVLQDAGWQLASADGYPAETEKVEAVIELLVGLRGGEVIAENQASHESLRVGARSYDRRATLTDRDGNSTTVILGGGPRSSIHARRDGENAVRVARGTAIQSIRGDARNYVDTEYVAVDKEHLDRIEVVNSRGRFVLIRSADHWALEGVPEDTPLDASLVDAFISNVARMTLQTPVGKRVETGYGLDDGAHVTLTGDVSGESVHAAYTIGSAADERSYYAKAEDDDFVVTVPKWGAEQIRDKTPEDFISKPAAD